MEIKKEEHHRTGAFYIDDNGDRLGEMRYLVRDGVMNIYHTEVDEKLQGQHMGEKMVEAGVKYARENHFKVLPTCTFARSVFNRTPAYADVLVHI
jgi:predicted GNAT family acetyltransferase